MIKFKSGRYEYEAPAKGMVVGLAHGCFDVLHFGHVLHLQAARRMCDKLIVCLTPNAFVNKGPKRPVFDETHRQIVIAALGCVDGTFIGSGPNVAINALSLVKPQKFFKGQEYQNGGNPAFADERAWCADNGVEVVFTQEGTFSTTMALSRLKEATE